MPALLLLAIPIVVAVLFLGIMTLPDEENSVPKSRNLRKSSGKKKKSNR